MQYVEVDGHKSALRMLRTGGATGIHLRSTVILFYINDLINACQDVRFILFADDTTCLTSPDRYFRMFVILYLNGLCNRLCLNVTKTKFMLFTNRNVMSPLVKLTGVNVECVETIKFLRWDNSFSWHAHATLICSKISRGVALLRYVNTFYPVWVKRLMYVTILLYSPTLLLPWNKQQRSLVTSLIYLSLHRLKTPSVL
jgi:hypothetical protein